MFNDVTARQFAGILESDVCIRLINFCMPQHTVNHKMFLRVAAALKNGDIRVAVNIPAPKDTPMRYNAFADVISVSKGPEAHDVR